eukprot:gene10750-biopygen2610
MDSHSPSSASSCAPKIRIELRITLRSKG